MRGTRLVHLPINFRYSDNGTFKEDCAVSLSAPSLDQFSVHNAMVAYASEATRNNDKEQALTFAAMAPALETLKKFREEAISTEVEVAPAEETDEQRTTRVVEFYAQGLGEKFPAFMEYLKKTLTNNPKLARVGDTKQPLRDESWEDIASKGGMDAVLMVFAGFAGFFLKEAARTKSQEANGSNSRAMSPSRAEVH